MTIPFGRRAAGALLLSLLLAACTAGGPADSGGSGSATGSPAGPSPTAPSSPTPVPMPSSPGSPGAGDGGAGGGSQPNPGSSGLVHINPGNPVSPPAVHPEPTLVEPVAGLLGVHPVGAVALLPTVDGRHVTVQIAWWSGVEPCNVLAGVDTARQGRTITLTVREGAARLDVACIEIAVYKATVVDLGELAPGAYTIAAHGEATPVSITVAG